MDSPTHRIQPPVPVSMPLLFHCLLDPVQNFHKLLNILQKKPCISWVLLSIIKYITAVNTQEECVHHIALFKDIHTPCDWRFFQADNDPWNRPPCLASRQRGAGEWRATSGSEQAVLLKATFIVCTWCEDFTDDVFCCKDDNSNGGSGWEINQKCFWRCRVV